MRTVFDVALTVHKNIQQRDLEVGRNLGNWILRWLDRMKPSAQIRVDAPRKVTSSSNDLRKFVSYQKPTYNRPTQNFPRSQSLFSRLSVRARTFPTLSRMLRPMHPAGVNSQYRQMLYAPSLSYATYNNGSRVGGVFREDIKQWMMRG